MRMILWICCFFLVGRSSLHFISANQSIEIHLFSYWWHFNNDEKKTYATVRWHWGTHTNGTSICTWNSSVLHFIFQLRSRNFNVVFSPNLLLIHFCHWVDASFQLKCAHIYGIVTLIQKLEQLIRFIVPYTAWMNVRTVAAHTYHTIIISYAVRTDEHIQTTFTSL